MVQTRIQLENLSKDELIDEVLSFENFKNVINMKFSKFNDVLTIFKQNTKWSAVTCWFQGVIISFYLSIYLNYNTVTWMTLNMTRETLEINPVSSYITDDVLEQSLCQAVSLTAILVEADDLQACHCMRKKD